MAAAAKLFWRRGWRDLLAAYWATGFIWLAGASEAVRWSFYEENRALLRIIEHALHQHSMNHSLIGRFVGPMSADLSVLTWWQKYLLTMSARGQVSGDGD